MKDIWDRLIWAILPAVILGGVFFWMGVLAAAAWWVCYRLRVGAMVTLTDRISRTVGELPPDLWYPVAPLAFVMALVLAYELGRWNAATRP